MNILDLLNAPVGIIREFTRSAYLQSQKAQADADKEKRAKGNNKPSQSPSYPPVDMEDIADIIEEGG